VVGGEAFDAVARRDVAEAGGPEGEGVDEGFAEDDLLLALEPLGVEDAAVRPREVEMERRAGLEIVADLAAVDLRDVAGIVEDRDDEGADEVLVARVAEEAELLEPGAHLEAGLAVHQGDAQAEGAVGVAELEVVDEVGMRQAALLEIRESFRALLEALVVVGDDLPQDLLVAAVGFDGKSQGPDGGALWRRRGLRPPRLQREVLGEEDLDGVAEADPFGLHHPVDRRAARLAGAEAVPEVLGRGEDKGGFAVRMKRAQAQQVRPVPLQLDALPLGQAFERDLRLDPLEQLVGDARHERPFPDHPVKT